MAEPPLDLTGAQQRELLSLAEQQIGIEKYDFDEYVRKEFVDACPDLMENEEFWAEASKKFGNCSVEELKETFSVLHVPIGPWSENDIQELLIMAMEEHLLMDEIAEKLGRSEAACREEFEGLIRSGRVRRPVRWKVEESVDLQELAEESRKKHGHVKWEEVLPDFPRFEENEVKNQWDKLEQIRPFEHEENVQLIRNIGSRMGEWGYRIAIEWDSVCPGDREAEETEIQWEKLCRAHPPQLEGSFALLNEKSSIWHRCQTEQLLADYGFCPADKDFEEVHWQFAMHRVQRRLKSKKKELEQGPAAAATAAMGNIPQTSSSSRKRRIADVADGRSESERPQKKPIARFSCDQ